MLRVWDCSQALHREPDDLEQHVPSDAKSPLAGIPVGPATGLGVVEDVQFLMRDELRGHRLSLEFERAEFGLRDHKIRSTIVVFGSSRARPPEERQDKLHVSLDEACDDLDRWYDVARTFGRIVSERGGAMSAAADGFRENVIATGGGPGLMEAANRGARDAGAPTIGFNIELPVEQKPNAYISPGLVFHFHYFAVRKMHLAMRANALAVFPGGFGTLDELFEILTLKQTRKTRGMPVLLFCRKFWRTVIDFEALTRYGTIDEYDRDLFSIVDTAEEGWECLMASGLALQPPLHEN